MSQSYEAIRQSAISWIKAAGDHARQRLGHASVSRKADQSVVTDVDHEVQEMILSRVAKDFPKDAVISEETQERPGRHGDLATAKRCWVVDPIDGTRNYARGFPIFSTSVALMEEGRTVVGWIYAPMSGRMYSAAKGHGAWLEDRRLEVTRGPMTGRSLFAMPSVDRPLPQVAHGWIDTMVFRNLGSTALHLALLAAGDLDAVFVDKCMLWDMAAGALLVAEAGGEVLSLDGRAFFPIDVKGYDNEEMPFIAGGAEAVRQLLDEYQKSLGAD